MFVALSYPLPLIILIIMEQDKSDRDCFLNSKKDLPQLLLNKLVFLLGENSLKVLLLGERV